MAVLEIASCGRSCSSYTLADDKLGLITYLTIGLSATCISVNQASLAYLGDWNTGIEVFWPIGKGILPLFLPS